MNLTETALYPYGIGSRIAVIPHEKAGAGKMRSQIVTVIFPNFTLIVRGSVFCVFSRQRITPIDVCISKDPE